MRPTDTRLSRKPNWPFKLNHFRLAVQDDYATLDPQGAKNYEQPDTQRSNASTPQRAQRASEQSTRPSSASLSDCFHPHDLNPNRKRSQGSTLQIPVSSFRLPASSCESMKAGNHTFAITNKLLGFALFKRSDYSQELSSMDGLLQP
eukprot:6460653-Amphidinium_carterae.1